MYKKLVSLILATVMVLGMLAGCSTNTEDIDVEAGLDDRPIGGLGIHLVKTIMDTMTYQRTVDGYNVLTLTKQIN